MAINKTAKNMYITIAGDFTRTAKEIEKTSEKITILATKGDIELISNRKVVIKGNKS
jgi:hypothetical protein